MIVEFETSILGGLPVIVRAKILPAEPDVGIFSRWVDDFDIFWPRKPYRSITDKVYDKIPAKELDAIRAQAIEQSRDYY